MKEPVYIEGKKATGKGEVVRAEKKAKKERASRGQAVPNKPLPPFAPASQRNS
jgi:hypothetical protein